jgi:hypothetical protein
MLEHIKNITIFHSVISFTIGLVWVYISIKIGMYYSYYSRFTDLTIKIFKYRLKPVQALGEAFFYIGCFILIVSIILILFQSVLWLFNLL